MEYRVLARKYRPMTFDDLVGQEVLVQTLSNAIARNRLAHAFLLTGIRGIGKTTTARIIAKALNCIGTDQQGGPTISPCGECSNCVSITEDRHVDVLEMDAASRTGVDDIRSLIETVHYAPASARYKVYIIDEVHMLSKSAFNALLKTLEEPPENVKFIFATTELRKIPVTILSRCQRFDLKRLDTSLLAKHLANICSRENVSADEKALELIAAAAEGSVRDGLSMLDQAIAHADESEGTLCIATDKVEAMLGLADKARTLSLVNELMHGNLLGALETLQQQYAAGADPLLIMQDVLQQIHLLTTIKANATQEKPSETATELASSLSLTQLTRAWQMVLKGIQEMQMAPNPMMAAEMILIRVSHMAELPPPAVLIKQIQEQKTAPQPQNPSPAGMSSGPAPQSQSPGSLFGAASTPAAQPMMTPHSVPDTEPVSLLDTNPKTFDDIVALFYQHKEMILFNHLDCDASLVSFKTGQIEINFSDNVAQNVPGRIGQLLTEWTGNRWTVVLSQQKGELPRAVIREQEHTAALDAAQKEPLVAQIIELFPGSELIDIEKGDA